MLFSFLASIALFHFVASPVVNMRESPKESAPIVSQAYFSEEINVIEKMSDWIKIETVIDHYQGWITLGKICKKEEFFSENPLKKFVKVNRCMAHLYDVPDTIYGPIMTLPFESLLEMIDLEEDSNSRWIKVILEQREMFIQRGDVTFNLDYLSQDQLASFSFQFLGLPYTWGGRSSFGYDCSGFVQMLYRQTGVYLPRDSKDQAQWDGFKVISTDDLAPGDLIFFGLNESKIQHVGMYVGKNQFIHATVAENAPYIHISYLSDPDWNGLGNWAYRTARSLKKSVPN